MKKCVPFFISDSLIFHFCFQLSESLFFFFSFLIHPSLFLCLIGVNLGANRTMIFIIHP